MCGVCGACGVIVTFVMNLVIIMNMMIIILTLYFIIIIFIIITTITITTGNNGPRNNNRSSGGEVSIYVGNISYDTKWQSLKDHFKQCDCTHADILMREGT